MTDILSALSEAERRYDVIPDAVRENIRAGGTERRALAQAEAQAEFFKYLIASQTKAIRYHRRRGEPVPAHKLDDFQMYRRQYRWWHWEARRLRQNAVPFPITPTKDKTMFRQGDVLLIPVPKSALTEDFKKVPRDRGRIVLAYGEVTGHAHAVLERDAVLFDNGKGVRILAVDSEAALVHEEHGRIALAAGQHYEVRRQREYHPDAIRNVAD